MNQVEKKENYGEKIFESIKHVDKNGIEYWEARELQIALKYSQWRNFEIVIDKAKVACQNSRNGIMEHFADVSKTIDMPKGAKRMVKDYYLSRYACYLIVQNGDSRKEMIALGQTYFALQTRRQELSEKEYIELSEDEKRLYNRNIVRKGNYQLNQVAHNRNVKNFGEFHNAGYRGLYNGESADDIAKRKHLRYREDILDNMGSDELAANIFRISQTKQKLVNEHIEGDDKAQNAHYQVGKAVRDTIKLVGGTMPEKLPTPNKSLKTLEKENYIMKK